MADLTITISNTITCFGLPEPNLWNGFNWGLSSSINAWGYGNNSVGLSVEKLITESQSLATAIAKESEVMVSSPLDIDSETGSETLTDGSGYSYVFPRPTTEAEERVIPVYSEAPEPTTDFATAAEPSTNWSESRKLILKKRFFLSLRACALRLRTS
jgi:hypothetical protein